jgi:hypothetical protein
MARLQRSFVFKIEEQPGTIFIQKPHRRYDGRISMLMGSACAFISVDGH